MSANLDSGSFKIVSRVEGRPTSILPTWFIRQTVCLDLPIQLWTAKRVGENIYRLRIEGYDYTGVHEDKVSATGHPEEDLEWHVTQRAENTFTIELAKDHSRVWTVSAAKSPNPEIEIQEYKPDFAYQLFQIERA